MFRAGTPRRREVKTIRHRIQPEGLHHSSRSVRFWGLRHRPYSRPCTATSGLSQTIQNVVLVRIVQRLPPPKVINEPADKLRPVRCNGRSSCPLTQVRNDCTGARIQSYSGSCVQRCICRCSRGPRACRIGGDRSCSSRTQYDYP